jgi:hypothetical protein
MKLGITAALVIVLLLLAFAFGCPRPKQHAVAVTQSGFEAIPLTGVMSTDTPMVQHAQAQGWILIGVTDAPAGGDFQGYPLVAWFIR